MTEKEQPNVIICGGGPAGLLASILLSNLGISSTILERAREPDQWSSKSYTLVLNARGKGALQRAGCLESATKAGNERQFMYLLDGKTGNVKAIPSKTTGIGLTRPLIVECLEKIVTNQHPKVTMKRSASVESVVSNDGLGLDVRLEDGTVISGTHVIGADGKWSKVRQSFKSLSSQAKHVSCPAFGVHMNCPTIPDGWKTDGTYIVKPPDELLFYVIVSPRPDPTEGLSLSMVCYEEIAEKHPWLVPPDDMKVEDYGKGGWTDEYSARPDTAEKDKGLSDNLEKLFLKEVPVLHEKIGKEPFQSARINRRANWLQMTAGEDREVSYSTEDGLVALIGDAAHAMTASMGEGCNTALESAVGLVDSISSIMEEKGETDCSTEIMSEAFLKYGSSRPKATQPIQEASAARNVLKK